MALFVGVRYVPLRTQCTYRYVHNVHNVTYRYVKMGSELRNVTYVHCNLLWMSGSQCSTPHCLIRCPMSDVRRLESQSRGVLCNPAQIVRSF